MKKFVSLALAGSLLVSLVGCGASSSAAPASTAASGASSAVSTSAEISLGVTAPLTGSLATYGESVQKGVNLAIDEINAAGGAGAVTRRRSGRESRAGRRSAAVAIHRSGRGVPLDP